jgi:RNA polymerase sigma factor (sigma-70 family)
MWKRDWKERSDNELVAACLTGEAAAWEALILRYQRLIFHIPLRMGFGQADAEDIFQNVSLKLCLHLSELRDTERLAGWIAQVARQEGLRLLRRKPTTGLEDAEALADARLPEMNLLAAEQTHLVRLALEHLPEKCQKLLGLLYAEEAAPYADVSQQLGIPLGSIGPQRARCLERLKKKWEELDS